MSSQKPASSSYLECPATPGASFLRSRSSGSSTSSLSSTFSDITSSTSASSSSPPNSKTNAFFASPFSTRPPTPTLPTPPPPPPKPRSLTEEFFAAPIQPPSPPASSILATTQNAVHPSRIFPSRYTSSLHRSPDFNLLNYDSINEPPNYHSREREASAGSDSSYSSSFIEQGLPTPPPSALAHRSPLHRDDTITPTDHFPPEPLEVDATEEPTPRPADLEPTLLHFERSLLLARQKAKQAPEAAPEPLEDDGAEYEEPQPGSIISFAPPVFPPSHLPLSPLSLTFTIASPNPTKTSFQYIDRETPTPTNESSISVSSTLNPNPETGIPSLPLHSSPETAQSTLQADLTEFPKLRLLKSLGHGAFSTVWLAEDMSPVALTLVSKQSVRDLRRRASGRERERELEKTKDRSEIEPALPDVSKLNGEEPPKKETSTRRPPSRLREGLKNMLSFSRSSGVPSPISPVTPVTPDGPLSRTSSIKSASSNNSEVSLSRNSSIHSARGLSRNSSLRLALQHDTTLSRDSSLKKFRERVKGTRPAFLLGRAYLDERHGEMGEPRDNEDLQLDADVIAEAAEGVGLAASLSRHAGLSTAGYGRLVAVKMTPRKARGAKGRQREEEERTRVGFVREVEVLKHISHPNITPLLAHLSTSSHHILVLPYLPGGDLLGLVNNEVAWGMFGETVLKRIWRELCKAVGWMHGVGLVHRDIKLENILLTTPVFSSLSPSSTRPTLASLPPSPAPFIKLTDFGLSRFVEIDANGDAELLATRCGSEAYAAPELVTGGGGPSGRGVYDARKTDAWACGVVLYALVVSYLPFGEGANAEGGGGNKIGSERGAGAGIGGHRASAADRRHWLMRIARGEWEWPGDEAGSGDADEHEQPRPINGDVETEELVGPRLAKSRGARRIVSRLLVRDPRKRARISDLWDDAWMQGGEEQRIMEEFEENDELPARDVLMGDEGEEMPWAFYGDGEDLRDADMQFYDEPSALPTHFHGDHDVEEEEEEGGCLLDQEGIDSITRQEVI